MSPGHTAIHCKGHVPFKHGKSMHALPPMFNKRNKAKGFCRPIKKTKIYSPCVHNQSCTECNPFATRSNVVGPNSHCRIWMGRRSCCCFKGHPPCSISFLFLLDPNLTPKKIIQLTFIFFPLLCPLFFILPDSS